MTTAKGAARAARSSTVFRRTARAGYVVLGLVHILIGAIAVSIAAGASGDADQDGAMEQLRRTPIGGILLAGVAVGLFALAVWQVGAAMVKSGPDETRKWGLRVKLLGSAIAYVAIGAMAMIYAVGGRADSEKTTQDASAGLIATPGGAIVLVLIGLGVAGVGIGFVVGGITRSFEKTMSLPDGPARQGIVVFGVIGYLAKGLAVAATGALVVIAGFTRDPEKAAGLDGALHSLVLLPQGRVILWVVGAGLAVYGIFCFVRARLARM
ncbi:DUF1206 domain-containing protein [Microbacterium sp. SD291]|uniref:DUF1206 domain-containing protein n=1 Tax=Microbacterium sp. SD291 TaxID=2782007 RepID=UPI001A9733E2|nr:DUF1206 domain-containing protein [Microbacterium sp. SD291]MBO0981700.1 DUF1206 domain-containing protein [Microbacterium sp. SD291]